MPIRQQWNSCWSHSCYCTQQKCFTAFWGVTKLIISETEVLFALESAWIWFYPDPRCLVSCVITSIKAHIVLWRHAINSVASCMARARLLSNYPPLIEAAVWGILYQSASWSSCGGRRHWEPRRWKRHDGSLLSRSLTSCLTAHSMWQALRYPAD